MKRFQNILIVLTHNELHEDVFRYAASVVSQTKAQISFAVLHPELPVHMREIAESYYKSVTDHIRQKSKEFGLDDNAPVIFEHHTPYFVTVTQMVMREGYDLIIKAVENPEQANYKGLKSLDMSLLRKCPCPIWLCRPLTAKDRYLKVLTAVDPACETPEGYDLNKKLMVIGESFAQMFNAHHEVITCWEFEHEDFLRHSAFARIEGLQVDETVHNAENEHKAAMHKLMKESGISPETKVIYERGKAESCIPPYVQNNDVDIVVMGTVARTGIEGFLIGNTAENIIQNLNCSLFTAKPDGFVSPIKL